MDPRARDALIATAIFTAGLLAGFWWGRSGREEPAPAAVSSPFPSAVGPSPSGAVVSTPPPQVVTPSPGLAPAIGTGGAVLAEGDRAVVSVAASVPCTTLITTGLLGECGEVPVAGNRVVWVVESSPTATAARSRTVRVFTYVPDETGWVEWLGASDPGGERWIDVNVLEQDLTGDGVPELLFGYRGPGDEATLDVDIVSYTDVGLPRVVAHPETAARGSATLGGGTLELYAAQYPGDEPACCPPVYVRSTIVFDQGSFRITATEDVPPTTVPASQL
jgi:hypothetical protein